MKKFTGWGELSNGLKMRYTKIELGNQLDEETIDSRPNTTFICIPGNPGNEKFYEQFGEWLLRDYSSRSGHRRVNFIAIAHLNHVPFPQQNNNSLEGEKQQLSQGELRFNLDEQVQAKIDFFCHSMRDLITKDGRIYLIGHSIGAYISLKMLPQLLQDGWNVISCFCLFPTVEEMANTENGRWVAPTAKIVNQMDWFFRWLFWMINFLPTKFKKYLLQRHLGAETSQCVIDAVIELTEPLVARNIVHMANHEMQVVRQFDHSPLDDPNLRERVVFFYGCSDKWAPLEFAERMRQRFPEVGRVLVDSRREDPFEHAFVLRHSREMAQLLVDILLKAP